MADITTPSNPCERAGSWYWFDETGEESSPYPNRIEAEIDLLLYCQWLNTGEDLRPRISERWAARAALRT